MTDTQPADSFGHPDGLKFTIGAARVEKRVPDAYRLVTKDGGNCNTAYLLQGYFTWTQGFEYGGEWRDLETQDWLYAKDDVPFEPLLSNTSGGNQ